MPFLADLHVHSRYSRATSPDMSPESIWRWAQLKGISVMGTGDCTHPAWLRELGEKLQPEGNGLFALRQEHRTGGVPSSCRSEVSFILSGEISCIYRKNGRTRKVHALVLLPDLSSVERLNGALRRIGNLHSDGRPILGLDAKELLSLTLDASPDALFIPAHAWTPHFSVFGAASGFNSLAECFEELAPHIHAIETGLSSDPPMNWRISALDRVTLISNSDAHSASKIGREANILDTELSYRGITDAICTRRGFAGTIEFFPEEGKYHYDGHRQCGVCLSPDAAMANDLRCPACGGKLTVGVQHRVAELADRRAGERPADAPGYTSVVPLAEIIAETCAAGVNTKKVSVRYQDLLAHIGPELHILIDAPLGEIERAGSPAVAGAIGRMRKGRIIIAPGYDGVYGKIRVCDDAGTARGAGKTTSCGPRGSGEVGAHDVPLVRGNGGHSQPCGG
jgi:uncharacterized protein (TIGR00375 family)